MREGESERERERERASERAREIERERKREGENTATHCNTLVNLRSDVQFIFVKSARATGISGSAFSCEKIHIFRSLLQKNPTVRAVPFFKRNPCFLGLFCTQKSGNEFSCVN